MCVCESSSVEQAPLPPEPPVLSFGWRGGSSEQPARRAITEPTVAKINLLFIVKTSCSSLGKLTGMVVGVRIRDVSMESVSKCALATATDGRRIKLDAVVVVAEAAPLVAKGAPMLFVPAKRRSLAGKTHRICVPTQMNHDTPAFGPLILAHVSKRSVCSLAHVFRGTRASAEGGLPNASHTKSGIDAGFD